MTDLEDLARLVSQLNHVSSEISALTTRAPLMGNVGEYIASRVFGIDLHNAANHAGSDGHFRGGPLSGKSVNVKWYARQETLDINPESVPDVYLVLSGPRATATTRRHIRPWVITHVYIFDAAPLHAELKGRGVKIQVGTSLLKAQWDRAEVYPKARSAIYSLTDDQHRALALFGPSEVGP